MEDEELISRRDRLRQEREERLRSREERHSAPARIRLRAAAVLVIVLGLLSWLLVSWLTGDRAGSEPLPEPPALASERSQPGEEPSQAAAAESGEQDGVAVVHVAGAVQEPGVVEVPAGARVHEAVEEAGGAAGDAALEGLNLAEQVQDGVLIWVPTREELEEGQGPPAGTGQGSSAGGDEGSLINLNTADAAALEELPGIGPALSQRIVEHRETHGDFGSLEDLAAVSGIGPSILSDVEDLVTW